MNRQQESLKHKPSIAGNRAIRAHKRDVERKMLRDETLNRHRNLSAMSPLKENARNVKAGQKKSQEMKGEQDAKENRKQMLQKWKAERELKKKLQQREQGKKPMFRVMHIEPGTVPFSKPPPQRKRVDAPPVKIEGRVTRASVAAAKPPAASTRSAQGRTSTTGKVNTTRPKQSNASGPSSTRRSSTRPSNNKPKAATEVAPASRSTRARGTAPAPAVTANSKQTKTTRRTSNKRTDLKHVTRGRGESSASFAPDNFEFAPPANLSHIVFNPLSPVSAHSFMFAKFDTITESRRCSTPKVVPKRTSCVHSPPVSAVRPVIQSEKNSVPKPSALPKLILENGACETADVAVESATGTLSNVDELSTTAPVMSLKDMLEGNAENMPPPASTAVIRTPGRSLRQRRHTAAGLPASSSGSSSKKTPKCNSLILKHLSPEESINVLLHSPMVEVRRRTPKLHHTPGIALELPNFDDMDLSVAADPFTDVSLTGAVNPSTLPADLATQEKPAGEINGDIAASDGDTAVTGVLCDDTAKAGGETIVTGGDPAASGGDTAASGGDMAKAKSNDDMSSEHDVSYFRELLVSETKRLTTECEKWDKVISSTDNLLDDVEGQIRTTVGQAQLLMRQRFKQFSGLVDNCEFGTGEKATLCTDLQGFWDMVYFQVEDVDNKFAELSKLRSNNWVKEQKQQPKKKKIVKKPAAKKPVAAAKSKFGAFLAKMKQQKTGAAVEEGKEAGSGGQEDRGVRGKEEDSAVGTKEDGAARKEDDAAFGKEEDGKVGKEEDGKVGKEEDGKVGTEEDGKVGMIEGASVGKEMKTFDGGFFSVNSPVHSPVVQRKDASSAKKSLSQANSRSGSRANTPGGSCSSKSLLLMSVMKRISQSAQRRSSSPRLSSSDSPRTTRRSLATTPSGGSTGRKQRSRRSLAVCTQSDTPSVFTPRDSSILIRSMEGSSDQKQTDVVTDTCMESSLSRFLIPTKQETEESMDVDTPTSSTDDIDMSSQMKRNLSAEFDRQSLSKGKRSSRSGLVTPKYPKSAVKRRRNASEASSRRSTRHSVRFVDANESPVCERLPVTPFNRNSRVPRKRSNSSSCYSDSTTSPTFPDTLVDQSDNDTPVRKLARLTVKHTPTCRAPTPITKMPNLSEADEGETCERPPLIRDNLMSFSPVVMTRTPPEQSTMATTPNRTLRRSTRLSLL